MDSVFCKDWRPFQAEYDEDHDSKAVMLIFRLDEVRKLSGRYKLMWRWPGLVPYCDLLPAETLVLDTANLQIGDAIIQAVFKTPPTRETLKRFLHALVSLIREKRESYLAEDYQIPVVNASFPANLSRYVSG